MKCGAWDGIVPGVCGERWVVEEPQAFRILGIANSGKM